MFSDPPNNPPPVDDCCWFCWPKRPPPVEGCCWFSWPKRPPPVEGCCCCCWFWALPNRPLGCDACCCDCCWFDCPNNPPLAPVVLLWPNNPLPVLPVGLPPNNPLDVFCCCCCGCCCCVFDWPNRPPLGAEPTDPAFAPNKPPPPVLVFPDPNPQTMELLMRSVQTFISQLLCCCWLWLSDGVSNNFFFYRFFSHITVWLDLIVECKHTSYCIKWHG